MGKNVVIVGGHGNVSMRLAKLLAPLGHTVTSVIRDPSQADEIRALPATPLVLSLEDDSVAAFSKAFADAQADVVYFSAGSGSKDGESKEEKEARTRKVDYEGAVKVFDAIEGVGGIGGSGKKPTLILVSAVDIRNPDKIPEHYNDEDKAVSKRVRGVIPAYMHWKYEADKDLVQRTAFKWVILRPTGLTNGPGTGKATIGRTHLLPVISRQDVAEALALLIDREDAAGLAIDIVGGETPIQQGLNEFIKKGETDWLG
jgi:nucleoside-diphosphate-sugar epimerase